MLEVFLKRLLYNYLTLFYLVSHSLYFNNGIIFDIFEETKYNMNKLIGLFIVGLLTIQSSFSQEIADNTIEVNEFSKDKLNWIPTYKEALKKAKKERKIVLIYFTGSDWCGPCKTLDQELFSTEKFKTLADKELVLLEVDIPRRKDLVAPAKMKENLILQKKYKVKSFPNLMMVNYRGKKLGEKKGLIITEYYYPYFESIIRKY